MATDDQIFMTEHAYEGTEPRREEICVREKRCVMLFENGKSHLSGDAIKGIIYHQSNENGLKIF